MKSKRVSLFMFVVLVPALSAMEVKGEDTAPIIKWEAEPYAKSSKLWQNNMAMDIIKKHSILSHINNEKEVLDIGCGNGFVVNALSKIANYVYGIDCSESMIQAAQEDYVNESEKLTFECLPVQNLTLQDKFDVATAFFVLQWIPDCEKVLALKNIYNALKPGGLFFATCNPDDKNKKIQAALPSLVSVVPKMETIFVNPQEWNELLGSYQLTSEKIVELFNQAGFEPNTISVTEMDFVYDFTVEQLNTIYRPGILGMPFMKQLDHGEPEKILSQYVELVTCSLPKNENGTYKHTLRQFIIKAQKPTN